MDGVLAMWRALDDRLERVDPQSWGAVVTDARFPEIWDVNYARVESEDPSLTLAQVEEALEPALAAVGAAHRHVVVFHPERQTELIAAASTRGARLSWDLVMTLEDEPAAGAPATSQVVVREVTDVDDAFLAVVRASMREFDVTENAVADQLLRIEREVSLPAGKRWFCVRAEGRIAALGSLLRIGDVGLVDHVVTLPFARRRGFADAIVRRSVDETRRAGTRTVVLLTDPDGSARRIYERIGFRALTTIASTVERR